MLLQIKNIHALQYILNYKTNKYITFYTREMDRNVVSICAVSHNTSEEVTSEKVKTQYGRKDSAGSNFLEWTKTEVGSL